MDTTISLAQFHIEIGKPEKNLSTASEMVIQAADQGAQIVLLPELWTSGYDLPNGGRYISINQEIIKVLKSIAIEKNISIGGSYITRADAGLFNTFIMITPNRPDTHPSYHKIHLFRLLEEEQYLVPGNDVVTVSYTWGKAGLSICYDLRFPELFRKYARLGVSCLLNVAQWGKKRTEHWRNLIRARAIENQYFVAAVNACGTIHQDSLAGFSAIIDPWGESIVEADATTEVLLTAKIDLTQVEKTRKIVPAQEDNRTDLYGKWD